jgi:DNA-damage-inducible protein D
MSNIKLFEEKKVRAHWDAEKEIWYFSVIDVIEILTDSPRPRKYWNALKTKLKTEGNETSQGLGQLKMQAEDGKMRATDVADTPALLRIIQSIPSPKAEPFKQWLAKVGYERMQEINDPSLSMDRARENWQKMGRSDQNLRDHMSEAELIFTALAELSTRQIADSEKAKGLTENAKAGKKGGAVAKNARKELEAKTGKSVITGESFLPPAKEKKEIAPKTK